MSSMLKSATIQVRVTPRVKAASETVLWDMGLSMSEAVELFLRRIIVDNRIPFDVVVLDQTRLEEKLIAIPRMTFTPSSERAEGKTLGSVTRAKKKSKNFSGGPARPRKSKRENH